MLPLLGADSILMHREQKLAEAFSEMGYEVYYVNRKTNPFTGRTSDKQSFKSINVINVFGLPYLRGRFLFIYKINDFLMTKQFLSFLRKITKTKILYVTNPDWGYVVSNLEGGNKEINLTVYDISDDFVALAKNDSWKRNVKKYEEKLFETADKFVVTNDIFGKKIPKGKDCISVSNGVDLTGFDHAISCLKKGKYRALVGFIGGIYDWVDLDLIKCAAETFPDVYFSLIGPTNRKSELEELKKIDNIEIVGPVSKEKIANYFASLDVGMVPFVSEKEYPRLMSVDSNKIYQYMYFGYPIITTSFPQTRSLKKLISVAESNEEFIDLLRNAIEIKGEKNQERINYAKANTWEKKAKEITDFLF